MRLVKVLLLLPYFCSISSFSQSSWNEELLITPEKSNFARTSTHEEVMKFLNAVQSKSKQVHLFSMGKSLEGKDIPVAVLSKEGLQTAEQARANSKPVIYIQGNIHAGEVEGKEVIMMLMREILLGKQDNLVIQ